MKTLTRRTFVTGSAALLYASPEKTEAQSSWPTRPIRIVVPYPPGGQTDGIARAFGDYLARQVGKPVIIENKAGAGGVIGVAEAKRAEPDGTTILCTISSSLIQNRVTVKDLPYDPERDFIYLTMVSGAGGPVVAAKKTGATNLREFIEYAKKVGSLNWGSYGVGSTPHVLIETIAKQYGIKFQVIQYRGEAPMWNDIAGQTLDGAAGKASAGAVNYVPIADVVNIARSLDALKKAGVWTVGLDADAETQYDDIDLTLPTAVVVGAEGSGLRRLVRERCDLLASIPMRGQLGSLNVSVAAAVVLFEAVRQRNRGRHGH